MLIVFSGNTSWGMYNFRAGVMKKMIELGYGVCVVAPEDEFSAKIIAAGIRFVAVKKLKRYGINPLEDIGLYREYVTIYQALKPDFIFHYTIKPNIYGTLAAKRCNINSISIATGLGAAFSAKGSLYYFAQWLYKFSAQFATELWFLNTSDKALFIKNGIIPQRKGFLLPGEGVDTTKFLPGLGIAQNELTTFLLISRVQYDKGIQIFAAAIKLLKEKGYALQAILLGQIEEQNPQAISRSTIEQWQLEGIFQYLEFTSDVTTYIHSADAVVLPSHYKEGISRVLLEAACMAKPIITTRNAGCQEVVDDGINGLLCAVKDADDLAAKMEIFLRMPSSDRLKMGLAGRKKVEENFDEKIIIEIYKTKIEQYTGNKNKPI